MGFLKVILSRITGRKPSVNQMDHETIGINIREGSLFTLKESEDGTKEVVEFKGAPVGGSDAHKRAHQIDNPLDHPPVTDPLKKGKFLYTNPVTGAIELTDVIDGGEH